MKASNVLSDIAADLVSERKNEEFLERLFSHMPGMLVSIDKLVGEMTELKDRIKELESSLEGGEIQVTWIDYPNSLHGHGYCLVVFYLETLAWSYVALYNKALATKKREV